MIAINFCLFKATPAAYSDVLRTVIVAKLFGRDFSVAQPMRTGVFSVQPVAIEHLTHGQGLRCLRSRTVEFYL